MFHIKCINKYSEKQTIFYFLFFHLKYLTFFFFFFAENDYLNHLNVSGSALYIFRKCEPPFTRLPSPPIVFPDLLSGIPAGLHVTIILLCTVVVLFSSVASGFFFFNAFGRPYETLQGPMGLYLWTCICCETPHAALLTCNGPTAAYRSTRATGRCNYVFFFFIKKQIFVLVREKPE